MQRFEVNNWTQLHNVVTTLSNAFERAGVNVNELQISPITIYVRDLSRANENGDDDVKVALRSGNV